MLTLDVGLLNHLRSFKKHNSQHEFEPYYIEIIYAYLYYYQGNMAAEIFDEYCQQSGLTLKQVVLHIHFIFGSIANLNDLMTKLNGKATAAGGAEPLTDVSKSQANRTNIHCVHSIIDLQNSIDHTKMSELQVGAAGERATSHLTYLFE